MSNTRSPLSRCAPVLPLVLIVAGSAAAQPTEQVLDLGCQGDFVLQVESSLDMSVEATTGLDAGMLQIFLPGDVRVETSRAGLLEKEWWGGAHTYVEAGDRVSITTSRPEMIALAVIPLRRVGTQTHLTGDFADIEPSGVIGSRLGLLVEGAPFEQVFLTVSSEARLQCLVRDGHAREAGIVRAGDIHNSVARFALDAGGRCIVMISGVYGQDRPGTYDLAIQPYSEVFAAATADIIASRAGSPVESPAPQTVAPDSGERLAGITPLVLDGGRAEMTGEVSHGVQLIAFEVDEPRVAEFDLVMTSVVRGRRENAQPVLNVFEPAGRLIARGQLSEDGRVSATGLVELPGPGRYLITVTTAPNFPVLDRFDRLVGFPAPGETAIGFALSLRTFPSPLPGAPPRLGESVDKLDILESVRVGDQPVVLTGQHVGVAYAAYRLEAARRGVLTIEVVVTEQLPGLIYENDDSILYLFDADGDTVDYDFDSGEGLSSMITDARVREGVYYAVVTTNPSEPRFSRNGEWRYELEGLSNIEFNLVIRLGPDD